MLCCVAGIETTEEATWLTPCGCHSLLPVMGDLLAPAKSRAGIAVAIVVICGGCGFAIIEIKVVEWIVSLALLALLTSTELTLGASSWFMCWRLE